MAAIVDKILLHKRSGSIQERVRGAFGTRFEHMYPGEENFSSSAGYLFNFSEYGKINFGKLPP
jgi:hypothetical protein